MSETYKRGIKLIGILLVVYIALQYILPVWIPFFIAFLLVKWIYPWTEWLKRKIHLKREVSGFLILVILFLVIGGGLYFLVTRLIEQVCNLASHLDSYLEQARFLVRHCCQIVEKNTGIHAVQVEHFVYENMTNMGTQMKMHTIPDMVKNSISYLMIIGKYAGVLLVVVISVLLLLKDYEELRMKITKWNFYQHMIRIMRSMEELGGVWLRAQILIMLSVIGICVAGLMLLQSPYALLLGIVIGMLDALPFIGTGCVLIPWGIYKLILGNAGYGITLIVIFFVTNALREYLEPKLMGEKMGVSPILMVAAVYVGIYIYGISGVILGPGSLFLTMEIWKEMET